MFLLQPVFSIFRGALLLSEKSSKITIAYLVCFGLPLRLSVLTVLGIEGRLVVSGE